MRSDVWIAMTILQIIVVLHFISLNCISVVCLRDCSQLPPLSHLSENGWLYWPVSPRVWLECWLIRQRVRDVGDCAFGVRRRMHTCSVISFYFLTLLGQDNQSLLYLCFNIMDAVSASNRDFTRTQQTIQPSPKTCVLLIHALVTAVCKRSFLRPCTHSFSFLFSSCYFLSSSACCKCVSRKLLR